MDKWWLNNSPEVIAMRKRRHQSMLDVGKYLDEKSSGKEPFPISCEDLEKVANEFLDKNGGEFFIQAYDTGCESYTFEIRCKKDQKKGGE